MPCKKYLPIINSALMASSLMFGILFLDLYFIDTQENNVVSSPLEYAEGVRMDCGVRDGLYLLRVCHDADRGEGDGAYRKVSSQYRQF